MIYNFNLGIGWASSGVEYAQAYRASMLRTIGMPARFIFTDMFPRDNIEAMTANIGFEDSEIIWLYTFFTDQPVEPVTFTLDRFLAMIPKDDYKYSREGKTGRIVRKADKRDFYTIFFTDDKSDRVHRVEYVSRSLLIRKDYFTSGRLYTEYYAPQDGRAHLYQRRFFNRNGSVCYEELIDDDSVMYRFSDRILYSKEELVAYMVRSLHLTADDTVIIDRATMIGQPILENVGEARVGVVVHADHFSENVTTDQDILWNNYYEYDFAMNRHIDFYVCSTDAQAELLRQQFSRYMDINPKVVTIPVGGLDRLRRPEKGRRPFSIMTASRLASEKHVDWIIRACARARKQVPELTLDIYGRGGQEKNLRGLIRDLHAETYIRLMGQYDLKDIYQNYELYVSGSMSEGFGLTLMEAVGGGLPIVGFDVRYGNPTFIDDGQNGYLIPVDADMTDRERIQALADCIVRVLKDKNPEEMHGHSYRIAEKYLREEVARKWQELLQ